MKVYLVIVTARELYTPYGQKGLIAIYHHKEQAEIHLKALNDYMERHVETGLSLGRMDNPYDPIGITSDEVNYGVVEMELWDHFDQFQESQKL